jgi:cell division protein FtsB
MHQYHLLRKQVTNEKKKQRLVIFTCLVLVTLYLVWTLIFDNSGILRYHELKNKRTEILSEIIELQKKNVNLTEEIQLLKGDPFFMEKHAREDLNLSKPDEYIFIFDK